MESLCFQTITHPDDLAIAIRPLFVIMYPLTIVDKIHKIIGI